MCPMDTFSEASSPNAVVERRTLSCGPATDRVARDEKHTAAADRVVARIGEVGARMDRMVARSNGILVTREICSASSKTFAEDDASAKKIE